MTKQNFIPEIAPLIVSEGKRRGYKVFSTVIAQAIIESNWGQSGLSKRANNFFGLKCGSKWKGKSINMKTKEEYTVGTLTTIKDNFRAYDSVIDGVKGYYDFISTKRYANLKSARTPLEYAQMLKADGYATSSSYVNTLISTVNKYNLTQYDSLEMPVTNPQTNQTADSVKAASQMISQVVQDVIQGKYGNGAERVLRLTEAGYDAKAVQKLVNETLRRKG